MRKGHHDDNGIYNSTKRWKPLNEILQKLKCLYSHKGGQKKEFIYKIVYLFTYSYIFKPQSPSKHSPFDATQPSKLFPLLETVFELVDFDGF